MNAKHALPIVVGLILAIAAVVAYKLWPSTQPRQDEALAPLACDPAERLCSRPLPTGGRLDFSASPAPIRPLQTMELSVTLQDTSAETIDIAFEGTQMKMGMERIALSGDGRRFSGKAMLPICITGSMEWSATVLLRQGGRTLAVPFHFEVAAR